MRHVLIVLASFLVILGAAGTAAVLWRMPLAEWAGKQMLAREGYPDAEYSVETFTTDRLVLSAVSLGPNAPSAAQASLHYTLGGLLDGSVERAELHGLRVDLDLTKPDPLEGLRPLIDHEAPSPDSQAPQPEEDGSATPPPSLVVEDARITLRGVEDKIDIALDGRLTPENGDMRGRMQARATSPHTRADIDITVERLMSTPDIRLSAAGESDLARAPWPVAWQVKPSQGTARFDLSLSTRIPETGALPEPETLFDHPAEGTLTLDLQAVDLDSVGQGFDGRGEFALTLGDGGLRLRAPEPVTLTVSALSREAFSGFDLPDALLDLIGGLERASLASRREDGEILRLGQDGAGWSWESHAALEVAVREGSGEVAYGARGSHAPDFAWQEIEADTLAIRVMEIGVGEHRLTRLAYEGHLSASPEEIASEGDLTVEVSRLALEDVLLEGLLFDGPVGLSRIGEIHAVELLAPAELQAARWPRNGPLQFDDKPSVTIVEAQGTLDPSGLAATLRLDPGTLSGQIERDGDDPLRLRGQPGPVDVSVSGDEEISLSASLREGRVELPDFDLLAERVDLDATFDPANAGTGLRLAIGRLAHETLEPAFNPLRAKLEIDQTDERYRGQGEIAVLGTQLALPLSLIHNPEPARGHLRLGPVQLGFIPGGAQPGTLSPLAQPLRNTSGGLALDASVTWTAEQVAGHGYVELDALSFDFRALGVEGLNGRVNFSHLLPPNTNGVQHLRAARAVAGVPVEDLAASFTLEGESFAETVLQLHRAEGRFADGLVSVEDVALRPSLEDLAFRVDARNISIATLLDQLDVEALSGEGRLSGSVPIRVENGTVVIDEGRLEALSDGHISARLNQAGEALAQHGEQVSLMVRALQDFRYERFVMTLSRPKEGRTEMGMEFEGHNPDVLDGYPFHFNITFTGDVEPILLALQEGRRLSTDLMQEAIEGVR